MSTARILLLWSISVGVILGVGYLVQTDECKEKIKEIEKELAEARHRVTELEQRQSPSAANPEASGPKPPKRTGSPCLSYSSENKIVKVEGTISGRIKLKGRVELPLSYFGNCSTKVVVFENTGIATDRLQIGAHIIVHGKVGRFKGALEITPEKPGDVQVAGAQ
jgi:hypothetical protein